MTAQNFVVFVTCRYQFHLKKSMVGCCHGTHKRFISGLQMTAQRLLSFEMWRSYDFEKFQKRMLKNIAIVHPFSG